MAIGRTFEESLGKALRSLENGRAGLGADGQGCGDGVDQTTEFDDAVSPPAPPTRIFLIGRGAAPRHERGGAARDARASIHGSSARMADMVAVQSRR